MNRDTICVQGGYTPGNGEPRQIPIIQSTTFKYATSEDMGKLFDLEADGYFYSRLQNPTCDMVAKKICELEGGTAAMLTSSGQAANFFALFNICEAGDHIVASSTIYGGTFNLISVTMKKMGITATFVDPLCSEEELDAAFRPNTKVVFGETIANPALTVLDIEKFAKAAHAHGVPLIVDNTFPTPVNCRPFEWGADIVTHSTTKYMDGHGAVLGGAIVDGGKFDWMAHADKFPGLCTPDESYHGITYAERFGKEGAFITKATAQLMRDFGATVLCCTPSYALHLHDAGLEIGINIKDLPLRLGVFGAEPWTEEMRREIEDKLGITATNIYGLSEIMGPGVSQSCAKEQHGMHIWEDHFLPEIIDPVSGEILPEGSTGELVITTLTKQGIPLVRYRTRDITSLNYTPCSCGRTHVRMNRITGRSDDMLIIRGVNVFPSQIESLLLEVQGVSPHYQLILTRENNLDYVEVQVELDGAMFSDAIKDLQQREQRIQKGIKVEPHSLPRSEGKAVRVIDRRVMQ